MIPQKLSSPNIQYPFIMFLLLWIGSLNVYAQIGKTIPNNIVDLYLDEEYDKIHNPGLKYLISINKPLAEKTAEHIRMAYMTAWAGDDTSSVFSQNLIKIWISSYPDGKFPDSIPAGELADFYSIQAVESNSQQKTSQAIDHISESIRMRELFCRLDTAIQADAYQFLGRLMKRRYDNAAAVQNYRESIRLNSLIDRQNAIYGVILEKVYADLSLNPNDPNIILDLESSLAYYQSQNSTTSVAWAFNELGNYYLIHEEYHLAAKYFLSSLKTYMKIPNGKVDVAYNNLSAVYTHLDKPDSVLLYMKKALEATDSDNIDQQAKLNSNLGAVYGRLNRPDSALYYFTKAMTILYPGEPFEDINYNHNPKEFPPILPIAIAYKGNALFELSKSNEHSDYLAQAVEALKVSIQQFNKIRTMSSYENKFIIAKESRPFYFLALEAAASNYNENPTEDNFNQTIYFAQQAKSAVFNEFQRVLSVRDKIVTDEKVMLLEDSLKLEKSKIVQKYFNAQRSKQDKDSIGEINADLIRINEEIRAVSASIKNTYSVYADYVSTPDSTSLDQIRGFIDSNEALLDYTYSDDSVLIIIGITADDVVVRIDTLPSEFHKEVTKFLGLLSHSSGSDFGDFIHLGYEFYKLLIEPVKEFVNGKEIIIIPDGAIGYLPFDTFSTDSVIPSRKHYNELPILIKDYVIRYMNSMNQLNSSRGITSKTKLRVNAFAPFSDEPYKSDLIQLSAIGGSKTEIKRIAKHARVNQYYKSKASKETFKSKISSPDIIHLATHGLLSSGNPMNNRILFSQHSENSSLPLYEVLTMSLKSQMVVLSACETGTGDLLEGEGIMSLTRGFHNAGTPSLIMSLWPAYDLPSVKIMEIFYQELQNNHSIAEAIRTAKLDYLSGASTANSHPAYWANFQMSGKDAVIDIMKPRLKLWVYAVPAIFILALLTVFILRRKSRF